MTAWLRTIVNDPRTERMVMSLIIINAVILGLETSKTMMDTSGRLLDMLDRIILAVFVVELTARIIAHRLAFLRDPWSMFDFIVVGHCAGAGDGDLLGIARTANPAGAAPDHRGAHAQARGRGPAGGAARHGLDRVPDRAALLRLCRDGDQAVRGGSTQTVRHARRRALDPVHGDDAGRLDQRRRQAGDAEPPLCLDFLRRLHRRDHLHGAQPVHRRGGQRDAGGSDQGGRRRTRR